MRARWRLGQLLSLVERGQTIGPGRGHVGEKTAGGERPSFTDFLKTLALKETSAKEAQRIGALPEGELDKALAAAHQAPDAGKRCLRVRHLFAVADVAPDPGAERRAGSAHLFPGRAGLDDGATG
jgi:hypothetical protein